MGYRIDHTSVYKVLSHLTNQYFMCPNYIDLALSFWLLLKRNYPNNETLKTNSRQTVNFNRTTEFNT